MAQDPNQMAYIQGDKKFKECRYFDAAKHFVVAIEEWPEDWMAMHALGNCYSEMKKPQKAEKWFRLALKNAPPDDHVQLIYNLGNALYDQQRYVEAIKMYREVPSGHKIWPLAAINIEASEKNLENET